MDPSDYGVLSDSRVLLNFRNFTRKIRWSSQHPLFYWALWIFPFLLLAFIKDEKGSGQRITLSAIGTIFKNKNFLWFMVMVLIISIPHRMNDALLGLYLNKLGATDSMVAGHGPLRHALKFRYSPTSIGTYIVITN